MPQGSIRRSHLVTPFGVGAMHVLPNGTSVVIGALDYWFRREDGTTDGIVTTDFEVGEWRLEALLSTSAFRLPPDWRRPFGKLPNCNLTVPCFRFPLVQFCPRCQELDFSASSVMQERPFCKPCQVEIKKKVYLNQVPMVAMCENGHLQDFPWREWVHKSNTPACREPMKLVAGGGATLADQDIKCRCSMHRNLGEVVDAYPDKTTYLSKNLDGKTPYTCKGYRPWLGFDDTDPRGLQPCGLHVRGTLRNASNVYFAEVRSAIYLSIAPGSHQRELAEKLAQPPLSTTARLLRAVDGAVTPQGLRSQQGELLRDYSDDQIRQALDAVGKAPAAAAASVIPGDDEETSFRRQEYAVLRQSREEPFLVTREIAAGEYGAFIERHFARLLLVDKLKETRAFAGFSRILADSATPLPTRKALLWRKEPPTREYWLPAYQVSGEGIFIELNEARVSEWARGASGRIGKLDAWYARLRRDRGLGASPITPRFTLVHTLAHILMMRLTFECGYSSASLRERLYVSDNKSAPMAALLIYTAAGDSEGTMGGLVRMGTPEYLPQVLERALAEARWCSADPVCMELGAAGGQGPDSCNLAACHNCALVPETACEHFNRFLDRGCLVDPPGHSEFGFFGG